MSMKLFVSIFLFNIVFVFSETASTSGLLMLFDIPVIYSCGRICTIYKLGQAAGVDISNEVSNFVFQSEMSVFLRCPLCSITGKVESPYSLKRMEQDKYDWTPVIALNEWCHAFSETHRRAQASWLH